MNCSKKGVLYLWGFSTNVIETELDWLDFFISGMFFRILWLMFTYCLWLILPGNSSKGIVLCRHADVLLKAASADRRDRCWLIICKVCSQLASESELWWYSEISQPCFVKIQIKIQLTGVQWLLYQFSCSEDLELSSFRCLYCWISYMVSSKLKTHLFSLS